MRRLYNIVDQIFIANADYLGSLGNAANTVVFPLTVIALAIAVMIGDGCCAFVSIRLGAGESVYYTEFAVRSFRTYLCLMPLACINKATFIFLQSMGKPWLSTFLSMLREMVLGVELALLLPHFFALDGVLYSMPTADIITFAVSLVIIIYTYRGFQRQIRCQPA